MPSALLAQEDEEEEYERRGESFVYIDPNGKKGFMFGVNLGYHMPNKEPAGFYDGSPKGEGFLDLQDYLGIQFVRDQVQQELGVSQYTLEEYGSDMRYNQTIAVGGNLRYQFNWWHALVADVNFVSLTANDFFVLSIPSDNGTTQQTFQNFPIQGKEDRLLASMGYHLSLAEPSAMGVHFEFGPELTSLKVKSNTIQIGSRTYNILRAQTVGNGNQTLNNRIPTLNYIGGYAQLGANLEFDKFTIDLGWRTSANRIDLNPVLEPKLRFSHTLMARLVYRVTVKGF